MIIGFSNAVKNLPCVELLLGISDGDIKSCLYGSSVRVLLVITDTESFGGLKCFVSF